MRVRLPGFRHPHLYPSEASVIDTEGQCHGRCLRQVYYRLTNTVKTNPENARAMWIFEMGKAVEACIIEQCKQAGIWFDDHVKWYNPEYNLSGELDIVIRNPEEPDMLIGVEVKSFYGYAATTQIMGNRTTQGFPKIDQLLQAFLYVDWFRELLAGFKMAYMERGSVDRRDFDIEFYELDVEQETLIIPIVNGMQYDKFTLSGIYDRYRTAWNYYLAKELPPRDYRLYYSKDEMAQRVELGQVSKTDIAGFKRHPDRLKYRKADWNCRYCSWTNLCWDIPSLTGQDIRDLGIEAETSESIEPQEGEEL
jgi:hypothetical protein